MVESMLIIVHLCLFFGVVREFSHGERACLARLH